jgi:hypothetical protein
LRGYYGNAPALKRSHGTQIARLVTEAKQVAHHDGRLWDTEDLEDAPAARDRIADDSLRAEYLNQARELLRQEKT